MNDTTLNVTKARILVVEDELIIAMGLQKRLQALGYTVSDVVSSGEDAVVNAITMQPDLVLMDIGLSGEITGIEAAERIRLEVDIPVIYLTAYADPDSLRRAKITEPFGYIIKPYEDRDLHSTIEMALYKHEIESRLRWSEQWLATTLKCIGDGIIATDVAGTVTFMNPVAETLTGWKQGDALGRDLTMVFQIKCDDVETATAGIVQAVLKDGTSVTLSDHIFLVAKDESQLPIEVKATPIANVREHVLGLVLIFHDMTERKRVEEALRRSERSLAIKSQIANIFLTIPDEEMYGEVLKVILGVMKSPQGFFGYLEEKGVFVVPSLTKGIMSKCGVIGKTHEFLPKHCSGLWGRALREQQTYCSNGPFYLPEGHIQINCFLTVPVCFRGKPLAFWVSLIKRDSMIRMTNLFWSL